MAVQAIKDTENNSVVPVLNPAFSNMPETNVPLKQPKTNDELRKIWPRKYGLQNTGFQSIKPKVVGAVPPTDIRQLMLDIIKQIRMNLVESDDRTGGAFHFVFSMKTDEEIIDKILSLSDAEKLKDLLKIIDGTGYNWEEFNKNYPSVKGSRKCGIYMIGINWNEETLAYYGYHENTKSMDSLYIGVTLRSFTGRHKSHMQMEKLAELQLLKDIAGFNLKKNNIHYISIIETTRRKLEKDLFVRDLERGRVRSECKEDVATCFLKTAEAVFIAMFCACQTKQWFNHGLRKCMPFADPIIGLNAIPSLHFGEVGNMTAYTQNPRIEEKKDQFRSYTLIQLLEIVESVFEEFIRRRNVKKLENKTDLNGQESTEERATLAVRFKRLVESVSTVVYPKRRRIEGPSK